MQLCDKNFSEPENEVSEEKKLCNKRAFIIYFGEVIKKNFFKLMFKQEWPKSVIFLLHRVQA